MKRNLTPQGRIDLALNPVSEYRTLEKLLEEFEEFQKMRIWRPLPLEEPPKVKPRFVEVRKTPC